MVARRVRIEDLTFSDVASITDHTFLKTEDAFQGPRGSVLARAEAFDSFLEQALELRPYAVCVRHYDAERATSALGPSGINVASVVGFPNANKYVQPIKLDRLVVDEVDRARDSGASEIDFVLPVDTIAWPTVCSYVRRVHRMAHSSDLITKLILETCYNSPERIREACHLAEEVGVDFVKTSTGYGSGGASVEDLALMRDSFPRGIKISGGVTPENYKDLLRAANGSDEVIELDPMKFRIGASSLLPALRSGTSSSGKY